MTAVRAGVSSGWGGSDVEGPMSADWNEVGDATMAGNSVRRYDDALVEAETGRPWHRS